MPLTPGYLVKNQYRIVKLLGQGGFGAVYRAWNVTLNGVCAVKENLDASPAAQTQFAREASILYNLRHPNLPRVIDYDFVAGQGQYLVMDFIEGEDLQEKLDVNKGPLPEAQVLNWMTQICDAIIYLHSQNIIHRDLKPANIKITPQGQAMLVDFGIAKIYDPQLKTTQGARGVTPGYSPMEQYGQGTTDARTDVYALGATLYTLLTGKEPTEAAQRFNVPLPAPRSLNPAITLNTEGAILKAMQMSSGDRYQTMAEFKMALTLTTVMPPLTVVTPPYATPVPAPQHKYPTQIIVLGVVCLIVLGFFATWVFPRFMAIPTTEAPKPTVVPPTRMLPIATFTSPPTATVPLILVPPTATFTPHPTATVPLILVPPTATFTPHPTATIRSMLAPLTATSFPQTRQYNLSKVCDSPCRSLEITQIVVSSRDTRIRFRSTNSWDNARVYPPGHIKAFYIVTDQKRYRLLDIQGIAISPNSMSLSNGDEFLLMFERIDDGITTINVIEGDDQSDATYWNFLNIELR